MWIKVQMRGVDGGDRTCPVHVLKLQVEAVAKASGVSRRRSTRGRSRSSLPWTTPATGASERGPWWTLHPKVRGQALRRHITAIQNWGRWASSQVLEHVEEAPAATRRSAPSQLSDRYWAPLLAWEDRTKAAAKPQEHLPSQVPAYALDAVPATPTVGLGESRGGRVCVADACEWREGGQKAACVGVCDMVSAEPRLVHSLWVAFCYATLSTTTTRGGKGRTGSPRLRHEEDVDADFQVEHLRTDL